MDRDVFTDLIYIRVWTASKERMTSMARYALADLVVVEAIPR
jgi:hypothetical protein